MMRPVWFPARSVGPILAALMGFLLLLALGSEAALWSSGVWLAATILGLYGVWLRRLVWFSATLRLTAGLLLLLLVFLLSGWGHWLAIASQSVLVLLAVKALEMRSQRDFYQVTALVLLGMALAAWLRVDLLLGILLLVSLYLALLGLLWQPLADAAVERGSEALRWRDLRYMLLFAMIFLVALLPVTGLFFLVLPRTPTPLWAWAPAQGSAQSGFSPDLSPDQISQLALNPAVAFRAQISPGPVSANDLYWVGAILWKDEDVRWVRGPDLVDGGAASNKPSANQSASDMAMRRQEIVLSPGRSHYLFALAAPLHWQIPVTFHRQPDGVVQVAKAPDLPMRYTVWSGTKTDLVLDSGARQAALQIPADTSSAIRALAQRLAGKNARQTVKNLMHWFRGSSFHYSLQAPAEYPHGQTMSDFLLHSHTGFCEYYAGGLALLLRLDGVPARVVTGYHGGEYNPVGNYWIVRQSMAHAWVQAWLPGAGWVRLDATPASAEAEQGGSVVNGGFYPAEVPGVQRIWDWMQWQWINTVIDLTPAKQRALWTAAGLQLLHLVQDHARSGDTLHGPKISTWRPSPRSVYLLMSLAGLALLIVWIRIRARRFAKNQAGPDHYWRQRAVRALAELGLNDRRPGAEAVFWSSLGVAEDTKQRLSECYLAQRYGPNPNAEGDARLQAVITTLSRTLRR